jgi:hypothetical protein
MYCRTPLWLFSLFFLLPLFAHSAAPTLPATNFNGFNIEGNRLGINMTAGNGARRIIVIREGMPVSNVPVNGVDYNYDQDFGEGDELSPGEGEFVIFDGTGASVYATGLNPSTTYHFSIFEYNGTGAGTEYLLTPLSGTLTTLSAPAVQAGGLTFSNPSGFSLDLTWTRGDGAYSLVVARAGAPVDANPTDLSSYTPYSSFGTGSRIGTDNYAVYKGTGNTVTVTNLQPGVSYHFAVFEYNGVSGPVYLVPGHTGSATTTTYPTDPGSGMSFTSNEGNRIQGNWTPGDGVRRIVVVSGSAVTGTPTDGISYSASSNFSSGDEISPGEYVVYNGGGSNFTVQGLMPDELYYFKVFEYNGTEGNNTYYLTTGAISGSYTTLGPPTTGVQNITFSNVTGSSLTLSWTNGDGGNRLVLGREGAAVDYTPSDLEYFSSSSTNFMSATSIGSDNKVLYRGPGNSVTITNLNPGVTYHFTVFEYNGFSGPVYYSPGTSASQATDNSPPATAATNLYTNSHEGNRFNLYWTNGSGSRRIVVMREGSDVTAVPTNGIDYNHNRAFGSGDDIGSGEYIVYDGNGSSVQITNLQHSTTYYLKIFEYFGTGTYTIYQTTVIGSLTQNTIGRPATSASMSFASVTGNSMQVNFTGGDGERRLVVCRADTPVDAVPTDYTSYTSYSTTFGNSTYQLSSGQYIIYLGTGNNVTLNGLSPGVTYYFKTFEYNGNGAPVYELNPPDFSQATPTAPPTNPAQNISFNQIGAGRMNLNWSPGNGSRRVILAKAGAPVDAVPSDDMLYTASSTFGDGDEIGSGNYVVYDATGSAMILSGLSTGTTYHFAIFEYNSNGIEVLYLTPGAIASAATASPPTLPPSNLTTSDNSATSVQLGWTVGDGTLRMVIVSEGAPFDSAPVDGTSYNYSGNFSSVSTSTIGNGKVVYLGSGTSIGISGLQSGTTYYFYVFECNGTTSSPAILQTPASTMHTTQGPPQVAAAGLNAVDVEANTVSIQWTPGSGQKRLVVMRADGATNTPPSDAIDYTPNSAFGSGDELGGGNFAVYEGSGNTAVITGLSPLSVYHLSVYEFNFAGTGTRYLLSDPATLSFSTSALPVNCLQFKGQVEEGQIRLSWVTANEENNEGFSVQRSPDGINFSEIAWIEGNGTTDREQHYEWVDEAATSRQAYYYRLIQYDHDGRSEQACEMIQVQTNRMAADFVRISPNPFQEEVAIQLDLTERSAVSLQIMNVQGQLIKTLLPEQLLEAGFQRIPWQAKSEAGERVPPGMYLLRLCVEGEVSIHRLSLQ